MGDWRARRHPLAILPDGGDGALVWRVVLVARDPHEETEILVDARSGAVRRERSLGRDATGSASIFLPNPVKYQGSWNGLADNDDSNTGVPGALYRPVTLPDVIQGGCPANTVQTNGPWVHAVFPQPIATEDPESDGGGTATDVSPCSDANKSFAGVFRQDSTDYAGLRGADGLLLHRPRPALHPEPRIRQRESPPDLRAGRGRGRGQFALLAEHEVAELRRGRGRRRRGCRRDPARVRPFDPGRPGPRVRPGSRRQLDGRGVRRLLRVLFERAAHPLGRVPHPCWAAWDNVGLHGPTCERRADVTLPANQQARACGGTEVHCYGSAWSGALWAIRQGLGAAKADRLVLQGHFNETAGAGFYQGAQGIVTADRQLFAGADVPFLTTLLGNRNLLREPDNTPNNAEPIAVPESVADFVDAGTPFADGDDVYKVDLQAGQTITATLTAGASANFDLYLYAPGTTDISTTTGVVASSTSPGPAETFTYIATGFGALLPRRVRKDRCIDVHALDGATRWRRIDGRRIDGRRIDGRRIDGRRIDGRRIDGRRRHPRGGRPAGHPHAPDLPGPVQGGSPRSKRRGSHRRNRSLRLSEAAAMRFTIYRAVAGRKRAAGAVPRREPTGGGGDARCSRPSRGPSLSRARRARTASASPAGSIVARSGVGATCSRRSPPTRRRRSRAAAVFHVHDRPLSEDVDRSAGNAARRAAWTPLAQNGVPVGVGLGGGGVGCGGGGVAVGVATGPRGVLVGVGCPRRRRPHRRTAASASDGAGSGSRWPRLAP